MNAILKYQRYVWPAVAIVGLPFMAGDQWQGYVDVNTFLTNWDPYFLGWRFIILVKFVAILGVVLATIAFLLGKANHLLSRAAMFAAIWPIVTLFTGVFVYPADSPLDSVASALYRLTAKFTLLEWDYSYLGWVALVCVWVCANPKLATEEPWSLRAWRIIYILFSVRLVTLVGQAISDLSWLVSGGEIHPMAMGSIAMLPVLIFVGVALLLGYRALGRDPRKSGLWARWILGVLVFSMLVNLITSTLFAGSQGYGVSVNLELLVNASLGTHNSQDVGANLAHLVLVVLPPIAGLVWIAIKAKSFPEFVKAAPVVYATAPVQPQAAPVSYTVKPVGFDTETGRPILRYDEETGKPIYLD